MICLMKTYAGEWSRKDFSIGRVQSTYNVKNVEQKDKESIDHIKNPCFCASGSSRIQYILKFFPKRRTKDAATIHICKVC